MRLGLRGVRFAQRCGAWRERPRLVLVLCEFLQVPEQGDRRRIEVTAWC
jgi:hypothetical protein